MRAIGTMLMLLVSLGNVFSQVEKVSRKWDANQIAVSNDSVSSSEGSQESSSEGSGGCEGNPGSTHSCHLVHCSFEVPQDFILQRVNSVVSKVEPSVLRHENADLALRKKPPKS